MKIAFHTSHLCIRGTTVALYDYANHNEKVLGNTSIILIPKKGVVQSEILSLIRMIGRFQLFLYDDTTDDLDRVLANQKCDLLYCIKYGKNDGVFSRKIKTVIHCVFDMSEPHGDVYAGVSESVSRKVGSNLFVPHMVALTDSIRPRVNLREKLGIPKNAVVFGRYGGEDTFNLPFCNRVINKLGNDKKSNIYFLFINTPQIGDGCHIRHLPKISSEREKAEFITACDAHLECGSLGHSWGLAIGEFSVFNKPIIAYNGDLWNTAHIEILADNGIYFRTEEEFEKILVNFRPYLARNMYEEFSPKKVMQRFKKVFID